MATNPYTNPPEDAEQQVLGRELTHGAVRLEDRFWGRVLNYRQNGKCWLWQGATNGRYGIAVKSRQELKLGEKRRIYAHRAAWELTNGKIPEGMFVCHKCDNPLCVNPSHLFLGTPTDNMRDCVNKGRLKFYHKKGSQHGRARLNERKVLLIRYKYSQGKPIADLARKFDVGESTIRHIVSGDTWTHI